jgi:CBS domain-containing protein
MYLVSDVMTAGPVTIFPEDDLVRAMQLMRNGRLRHLPVVHHGKLVGLVTERDVLRELGASSDDRAETLTVRDVMVTNVITATANLPLRKAAHLLWQHKFGCLPVIDDDRHVIGILTETDFIRFAADIATDFDRIEAMSVAAQERHG